MTYRALLLLATLLLISCDTTVGSARILIAEYRQFDSDAVHAIFEDQSRLTLIPAEAPPGTSSVDALTSDLADLALLENSTPFVEGLRTVLPVFESVLHILARDDLEPEDLGNPLNGADFYVANRSAAGIRFIELVTHRMGLTPDQYTISEAFDPGTTDIIVYFGPIDPSNTPWATPGYSLVSLDNELNPQGKFYKEGIGYTAPNMKPKTIPALTYDLPGNETDIATVAVDTLLIARKDVSEASIYELTRTFLEQKPRFTAIAPHLFAGINESFDPLDLSFPLHRGARAYFERDNPGFIERYAETINMLVYVSFLLISASLAFARWRERTKKDRIDVFYTRIMDIRQDASRSVTERLGELDTLEQEAFDLLVKERLSANESFRIFTDLLATARSELNRD